MVRSSHLAWVSVLLAGAACGTVSPPAPRPWPEAVPPPSHPTVSERYVCYRAVPAPTIDGRLDDRAWRAVPWTRDFVDIRGSALPPPRLRTRAKMLWDDQCLYVAAELTEPHLWATLRDRDAVIYHDHDFEVFIDPDGDTHGYYELEINALGTVWDLFLVKPYRDGGPAVHAWDIPGLRSAVVLDGTLNDPSDTDRGWSVEIAIPWTALAEAARCPVPPRPGDRWWVDFSRVEWRLVRGEEGYAKEIDPGTGKPFPEDNWVWSPPGLVDMHYPEAWGRVQFASVEAGEGIVPFVDADDEAARRALRRVYYAQRCFAAAHGRFSPRLEELGVAGDEVGGFRWPPVVQSGATWFEAWLEHPDGRRLTIAADGRIWLQSPSGEDGPR